MSSDDLTCRSATSCLPPLFTFDNFVTPTCHCFIVLVSSLSHVTDKREKCAPLGTISNLHGETAAELERTSRPSACLSWRATDRRGTREETGENGRNECIAVTRVHVVRAGSAGAVLAATSSACACVVGVRIQVAQPYTHTHTYTPNTHSPNLYHVTYVHTIASQHVRTPLHVLASRECTYICMHMYICIRSYVRSFVRSFAPPVRCATW